MHLNARRGQRRMSNLLEEGCEEFPNTGAGN